MNYTKKLELKKSFQYFLINSFLIILLKQNIYIMNKKFYSRVVIYQIK